MDATESSAAHAHPPSEDQDHRDHDPHADDDHRDPDTQDQAQRPHACTDGVVYVGHHVEDPGTGEETEVIEAVSCGRCADSR